MLDPLTALSLAGNVIQFIDFSSKLVSKGREIYRSTDGALRDNLEIEIVTADFTKVVQRLMKHSGSETVATVATAISTDDTELELRQICEMCRSVATEFLAKLQAVKVTGKHRGWKSFRQALKSVWTKEEIDDIAQRLALFRQQLEFHIMVSFA